MKKRKMKKKLQKLKSNNEELRLEIDWLWQQQLAMLCFLESKHLLGQYLELFSEDELPFR